MAYGNVQINDNKIITCICLLLIGLCKFPFFLLHGNCIIVLWKIQKIHLFRNGFAYLVYGNVHLYRSGQINANKTTCKCLFFIDICKYPFCLLYGNCILDLWKIYKIHLFRSNVKNNLKNIVLHTWFMEMSIYIGVVK